MSLAYPLHWPIRQKRTPEHRRRRAVQFKRSIARASQDVQDEVRRLSGRELVISSNVELRIDGWPRSDRRAPDDPGVAVYFFRNDARLAFACDLYERVEQNLQAIAMHLEAMRGMERWGVGTLDQAFAGYAALPENAGEEPWWRVLGLESPVVTEEQLRAAWRSAAVGVHPDTGGSQEAFVRVRRAFDEGRRVTPVAARAPGGVS